MRDSHDEIIEHRLYTRTNLSGIWEDKVQLINNVYESRIILNRFSVLSDILVYDESNVIVNEIEYGGEWVVLSFAFILPCNHLRCYILFSTFKYM